jgi:HPt (histidine-containing phosphotransfer) domain-containing protein
MLSRRILRPVLCAPEGGAAGAAAPALDAAPAETETVLDEDALQRLRDLDPKGANRLLERVFEAFEASAARLIPQMELALRSSDAAGVRHVAHTLKSSSASIGALRLSTLCAEIEAMIRRDALEGLPTRVDDASREAGRVLKALKRLPLGPT